MGVSATSTATLDHVVASLAYREEPDGPPLIRVFPPSSGRETESLRREWHNMPVYDCRPIAGDLDLDTAGFQLLTRPSAFSDFLDPERVRAEYYPEVAALLKHAIGALEVFVFDHNVRSQARADRKEEGIREPVEGAHNDYTESSGPRRIREVLEDNDAGHLQGHRAALINVWRPLIGPVQDHPLAICDARTTLVDDFMPTAIHHFTEGNLDTPSLIGEVSSFRHNPDHRWYYVSDMQPEEVVFLKCFDLADDGRARWTGHTGFRNPACPAEFVPRESIEARTVAVFPNP